MTDERRDARTIALAVFASALEFHGDFGATPESILDDLAAADIKLAGPGEIVLSLDDADGLFHDIITGGSGGVDHRSVARLNRLESAIAAARTPAPEGER